MTLNTNHIITLKSNAILRGEFTVEDLQQMIEKEDNCQKMHQFKDMIAVSFSCIADAEFFADKYYNMSIETEYDHYYFEIN